MENKLAATYYSPQGYWKGVSAIKKLASAAKVPESDAREWLKRQAIWQIYQQAPRRVPRPMFDMRTPNEVHQGDLLFLTHDRVGRKTYKYALTLVDVASRYKMPKPLTSKSSKDLADAFERVYRLGPLTWLKLLLVDPGKEFMGAVSILMARHKTAIRRGRVELHRDQGSVERRNRTLAERLFGHQYAQEMLLAARGTSARSAEWVVRFPAVVASLNNEVTRLTGRKPSEAIRAKSVQASPSLTAHRTVGLQEPLIPYDAQLRYLYQPAEQEGGRRRRATDHVWSITTHSVRNVVRQEGTPAVYYLNPPDPTRDFVREELMIIPPDTELPPDKILKRRGAR